MGSYIVNGDEVVLKGMNPTARDLKIETGRPPRHWVMAKMPGGKMVQLGDNQTLPVEAEFFTVVLPHRYG